MHRIKPGLMVHAFHHAEGKNESERNPDDELQDKQDRPDDSTDTAGIGERTATGVHRPGIYLFKVAVAHHPGRYPKWLANRYTENAKHKNEVASMRFHIR